MQRLIVWGAGTLGGPVAAGWVAAGGVALGFTATTTRHAALAAAGIEPRLGDPLAELRPDDVLLVALPGSTAQLAAAGQLASANVRCARGIQIGTVGYFGDPQGTVDEDCPRGTGEGALNAAAAEAAFRQWGGDRAVVLRAAGLYQKGRGPLSALQRRGTAPEGPPNRTLALIHYDDAISATLAALRHPAPHHTCVLAMPPLPTRQEFYLAACVLLDLPLPRFKAPLYHPPAHYVVDRMRADLLPAPAHPRWQEALLPSEDSRP